MRLGRAVLTGVTAATALIGVLPAATASASTTPTACTLTTAEVTAVVEQPASGQDAIAVHVTAVSTCVAQGYPGAALVDARGEADATAQPRPRGYFGGIWSSSTTTPPRIVLQPGQQATALVEFGTRNADGTACTVWPALQVTLPHTTKPTLLFVRYYACAAGLSVNPLLPGSTGLA